MKTTEQEIEILKRKTMVLAVLNLITVVMLAASVFIFDKVLNSEISIPAIHQGTK